MDLFDQEEAQNPTLMVVGKQGRVSHVHDSIGKPQGLNRAPCGARPPMFGLQVLAMEHVLPTSWALGLRGEKSPEQIKKDHRQALERFLSYIGCAICLEVTKQFIEKMWAAWERREGQPLEPRDRSDVSRKAHTPAEVCDELAEALQGLGSLYIGAVELGERDMAGILGKLIFGLRVSWHFAAKLAGRVVPAAPSSPSAEEAPLLAKLEEADSLFRDKPQISTELAARMLDEVATGLEALGREASPALRGADFRFPGLEHLPNPDLNDFLTLQIRRLDRARQFVDANSGGG